MTRLTVAALVASLSVTYGATASQGKGKPAGKPKTAPAVEAVEAVEAVKPRVAPSKASPDVEPPRELLPSERAELERRVRDRCGLGAETPDSFLPWYYHYVLGMEYHRAGDDVRALDCLKSAVARKPDPKSGARIYGMWFLDYMPYSALAEVNERLGYSDCAEDARRLAESLEPPQKAKK